MTDTPRRRPPLPTREGTLKIKPRADAAPAAEAAVPDRRKAASGRNRGKASHPDQAQADDDDMSAHGNHSVPRGMGHTLTHFTGEVKGGEGKIRSGGGR